MASYPPIHIDLPQGAYSYQPLSKDFGPYQDLVDLSTDINAFLTSIPPLADTRLVLHSLNYQMVPATTGNQYLYTALLFYTEVNNI